MFCLDIGECASDPCQNSGTCIDEINAFTCLCIGGYTGGTCETSEFVYNLDRVSNKHCVDIDECESLPCENGGRCVDGLDVFTCQCSSGYTGNHCETSESLFAYNCASFYLVLSSLDIDECASFPCNNGGTCIDEIAYFTCHCIAGFTGDQCQTSEF